MGRVENVFPCTHWHLRKCLLVIVQISSHPNNSLITQALWCPVYFITFIKILLSITKLSAKLSQVQFWKPVRTNCPQSNKNWTVASSKITLFYDDVCTSAYFNHRVYICNCLQNIGFQVESILCEQCVLLGQLLSEKLQISIMVFTPKFNKFK